MARPLAAVLALLLLAPVALAQPPDDAILSASEAVLDAGLASNITLVPRDASPSLAYVFADLYFYPRPGDDVTVERITTAPDAGFNGSRYRFEWSEPGPLAYRLDARLRVRAKPGHIISKVPYPLPSIPEGLAEFTRPSEGIDSDNPAIRRQAGQLAAGEDDLFFLAAKVGHWVKSSVYYNLSTLTAEVSQPASWVLEHRIGVCDELTALFIAMLRSLGVPARYASGISYTNSPLFPDRWGAHGWAEVYFPGAGWVSFDVTFGEYGFINPGHIKMYDGPGPGGVSTRFEWQAAGYDMEPGSLVTTASILRITPGQRVLGLSVQPYADEVGFGSHNLITAKVRNLLDAYAAAEVSLASVEGLEPVDPLSQLVVLRPREERTIGWRVRVTQDLRRRFLYTFPLLAYTNIGNATAEFRSREDAEVISRTVIDALHADIAAAFAPPFELGCVPTRTSLLPGESGEVQCELVNRGPALGPVDACIGTACKTLGVPAGSRQLFALPVTYTEAGRRVLIVTARGIGVSAKALVTIDMEDLPAILVAEMKLPAKVGYGDAFTVALTLRKSSRSVPRAVSGAIRAGRASADFTFADLPDDRMLELELKGGQLRPGNNTVAVNLTFEDRKGREYRADGEARVELVGLTGWQRVKLFLRSLLGL